jgi:tetratricopeptide (TPR) repeat protein
MSRSLKVSSKHIQRAKLAFQRSGFPSQQALASEIGISLSTIKNFFSGKPVARLNFQEICLKLSLDWQEIAESANGLFEDGNRQDWGEAPDVSVFYGRTAELAMLKRWIVSDRSQLVMQLGLYEEAIVAFDTAIKINPNYLLPTITKGELCLN